MKQVCDCGLVNCWFPKCRNIVTHNLYPAIPVRAYDWNAHWEGTEETGPYGYGQTEAEAIADLTENYDDPN